MKFCGNEKLKFCTYKLESDKREDPFYLKTFVLIELLEACYRELPEFKARFDCLYL
jgi:hypothetical protein